jgi:hypothetical protein
LDKALQRHEKSADDLVTEARIPSWKLVVAADLRREVAASNRWLATILKVRSSHALRVGVCRLCNK